MDNGADFKELNKQLVKTGTSTMCNQIWERVAFEKTSPNSITLHCTNGAEVRLRFLKHEHNNNQSERQNVLSDIQSLFCDVYPLAEFSVFYPLRGGKSKELTAEFVEPGYSPVLMSGSALGELLCKVSAYRQSDTDN